MKPTCRPVPLTRRGHGALTAALAVMLVAAVTANATIPTGGTAFEDKKDEKAAAGFVVDPFHGAFALQRTDGVVLMEDGTPFKIVRTFSSDAVKHNPNLLVGREDDGTRWGSYELSIASPLLGGLWNLELGGRLVSSSNMLVAPRFALAKSGSSFLLKESLELRARSAPIFVTGDGEAVSFSPIGYRSIDAGGSGNTESTGYVQTAQGYQYVWYKRSSNYYVHEIWTSPAGYQLFMLSRLRFNTAELVDETTVIKPTEVANLFTAVVSPQGYTYALNYPAEMDNEIELQKLAWNIRHPGTLIDSDASAARLAPTRTALTATATTGGASAVAYARWSPDGLRVRHIISARGRILATVNFYNDEIGTDGVDYWSKPESITFTGTNTLIRFYYYHQAGSGQSPAEIACGSQSEICNKDALQSMESQLLYMVQIADCDWVEAQGNVCINTADDSQNHHVDDHDMVITYGFTVLGLAGNTEGQLDHSGTSDAKVYTDYEYLNTNYHAIGGVPFYPKGLSSVKYLWGHGNDDYNLVSTAVESFAYGSFDYSAYALAQDWMETVNTCNVQYPDADCGDESLLVRYPIELAKKELPYWRQYLMTSSRRVGEPTITYDYFDGLSDSGAADPSNVAYLPQALYERTDFYYGDLGRRVFRLGSQSDTYYNTLVLPTNYVEVGMQAVGIAASTAGCAAGAGTSCASAATGMLGLMTSQMYNDTQLPMTEYSTYLDVLYDLYTSSDPDDDISDPRAGVSGLDMQKAYIYGTDLRIPYWEDYYHNEYEKKREYSWDEKYIGGKLNEAAIDDYYEENPSNPSLYEDISSKMQWSKRYAHGRWSYLVPAFAVKTIAQNNRRTQLAYNLDPATGSPLTPEHYTDGMVTYGYGEYAVSSTTKSEGCTYTSGPQGQSMPTACYKRLTCTYSRAQDDISFAFSKRYKYWSKSGSVDPTPTCQGLFESNVPEKFDVWTNPGVDPRLDETTVPGRSGELSYDTATADGSRVFAASVTDPDGVEELSVYSTRPTAYSFDKGLVYAAATAEETFGKLLRSTTIIPGEEARRLDMTYAWGTTAQGMSTRMQSANSDILYVVEDRRELARKPGWSNADEYSINPELPDAFTLRSNFDRFGQAGTVADDHRYGTHEYASAFTYTYESSSYAAHLEYNLLGLVMTQADSFNGKATHRTEVTYDTFGRPLVTRAIAQQTSNAANGLPSSLITAAQAYYGATSRTSYGYASTSGTNASCAYDGEDDSSDDLGGLPCWSVDGLGNGAILGGYRYGMPAKSTGGKSVLDSSLGIAALDTTLYSFDTSEAFASTDTEPVRAEYDYTGRQRSQTALFRGTPRTTHYAYRIYDGRLTAINRPDPERDSVFEYVDPPLSADATSGLYGGNCQAAPANPKPYSIVREKRGYLSSDSAECLTSVFDYTMTRTLQDTSSPYPVPTREEQSGFGGDTASYTSREVKTFTSGDRLAKIERYRSSSDTATNACGSTRVRTDTYRLSGRLEQTDELVGDVCGSTTIVTNYAYPRLEVHTTGRNAAVGKRVYDLVGFGEKLILASDTVDTAGVAYEFDYSYNTYGALNSIYKGLYQEGAELVRLYYYDQYGRERQVYSPAIGYRHFTHYENGAVRSQDEGSSSTPEYDQFYRMFEYDAAGRLVAVWPRSGSTPIREYTYENGLLVSSQSHPASGYKTATVDAAHAIRSTFDYYDPVRPREKTVTVLENDTTVMAAIARTFEYDATRKLFQTREMASHTRNGASQSWYTRTFTPTSDGKERLYTINQSGGVMGENGLVGYMSYKPTGELSSYTANFYNGNGFTVNLSRTYTADGLVRRIRDSSSKYADRSYTYNTAGLITSVTGTLAGQSYTQSYWYDSRNQLAEEVLEIANPTTATGVSPLLTYHWYEYDALGRRLERGGYYDRSTTSAADDSTDLTGSYIFMDSYAFRTQGSTPTVLDKVEIWGADENAGYLQYGYITGGRVNGILHVTGQEGTSSYVVESAGFGYDPLGQVVKEEASDGEIDGYGPMSVATYNYYDADGKLTYTIHPDGKSWLYVYEGERRVASLETSTGLRRSYLYTPAGLAGVASNETNHGFTATIPDHAGSVLAYVYRGTASTGGTVTYAVLDAYGNPAYGKHFSNDLYNPSADSGAEINPIFAEKHRGNGTGAFNFNARLMDPVTGQFLQPDPVEHLNWYAYASNDPVNRLDPNGRQDRFGQNHIQYVDDGEVVHALSFSYATQEEQGVYRQVEYINGLPSGRYAIIGEKGLDNSESAAVAWAVSGGLAAGLRAVIAREGIQAAGVAALEDMFGLPLCFAAGTLVVTETGPRPIEQIAVGERVWSRDEATGETGWHAVVNRFVTPDQPVIQISLAAESGGDETLRVTAEHPFWVEGRGWVAAQELEAGNELLSAHGGWLRVTGGTWVPATATVYNLEVADHHTYFVGRGGAWVHNSCAAKASGRSANRVPDKVVGRPTSEQQALIDMAVQDSKRMGRGQGPVTSGDADAYVELGNEVGVPVRAKPNDLSGAHGYGPVPAGPDASHIHVNGEHVPVPPGYTPPAGATVIQ
ncbi:MAG: Hint domain-containing protein [Candidatus Schekmanbacteria bacterium]|nr:Hint domain-containing protein [Candidatus Schekmanbacteria bacterium]